MQRKGITTALADVAWMGPIPYAFGQSGAPIKIGVRLPISGPVAGFGGQERRAVEQVIAKGGINGRKLEAIMRNSKADPTEATGLRIQLILDESAVALITGTDPDTLANVELTVRNKVPSFAMMQTILVSDPSAAY